MITRDRCDYCRKPFEDGDVVYPYVMMGSAADLDDVEGQRAYFHAPCATSVLAVIRGHNQRERMALAHKIAMSIKEG